MKKTVKTACIVLTVLTVGAVVWYFHTPSPQKLEKLPISSVTSFYIYDTTSDRETVGASDYVFVGALGAFEGYTYEQDLPYTEYEINVLQNLKGELPTDRPVSLKIAGGLDKSRQYTVVVDGDYPIPEKGKQYVFAAGVDRDGKLLVNAPNRVILSEDAAVIAQYQDAVSNEVRSETVQKTWNLRDHVYGQKRQESGTNETN